LIDAGAVGAFGGERPGRGQCLGQCCLGFLGQDQAAQATLLVGQSGGDCVVTIEPDGTFRRVRTLPLGILLAWSLIVTSFPPRTVGTLLKWLPALMRWSRCLRLRWTLTLLTAAKR
jgi:hypothetical protein